MYGRENAEHDASEPRTVRMLDGHLVV